MNCPYPQNCLPCYLLNNLTKYRIRPSMYFLRCQRLDWMFD